MREYTVEIPALRCVFRPVPAGFDEAAARAVLRQASQVALDGLLGAYIYGNGEIQAMPTAAEIEYGSWTRIGGNGNTVNLYIEPTQEAGFITIIRE